MSPISPPAARAGLKPDVQGEPLRRPVRHVPAVQKSRPCTAPSYPATRGARKNANARPWCCRSRFCRLRYDRPQLMHIMPEPPLHFPMLKKAPGNACSKIFRSGQTHMTCASVSRTGYSPHRQRCARGSERAWRSRDPVNLTRRRRFERHGGRRTRLAGGSANIVHDRPVARNAWTLSGTTRSPVCFHENFPF